MGGMITIASSCLIGSENVPLHFVLIISLSLLVSLALVAIGDIDRPFQGSVHVDSNGISAGRGHHDAASDAARCRLARRSVADSKCNRQKPHPLTGMRLLKF